MMLDEMKQAYTKRVAPYKMYSGLKIARTLAFRCIETIESESFINEGLASFEEDDILCYIICDFRQANMSLRSYSTEGGEWVAPLKDKHLKEEIKYLMNFGVNYGFEIFEVDFSLMNDEDTMKVYIKFNEDVNADEVLAQVLPMMTERLEGNEGVITFHLPCEFDKDDKKMLLREG